MSENKLTGNWDKAIKDMSRLNEKLMEAAKLATIQSAHMIETALVGHIQKQDLGWKGLSEPYKQYKKAKGLSTQIWIATSTTMQSITTQIRSGGKEAFVGVLRKGKGGQVLIAAVQEYGSPARNIPARPLFRPTLAEQQPKIKKHFEAKLQKVLSGVGK